MRVQTVFVTVLAFVLAPAAVAQSLKSDEIITSIAVRPVAVPNPVAGADGRVHLAYELLADNPSRLFVTLDKIEAVDADGRRLWGLEGDSLSAMMEQFGGKGRILPPGGSAVIFMDVSFPEGQTLPPAVLARITATRQAAGADGTPVPLPENGPVPATFTFVGARAPLGGAAVVVEPPLKGNGWVAVNGCCDAVTSHRGAVMAINGTLRVPERFAIDWVKLDDSGRIFAGDISKLESYAYYGVPVYAVADGVVVNFYDATDEQIPGGDAKGITTENVGGNMLVVDIGGGAYAFYAHLQRGTLKVKLGDRVKTGVVIGLLGNTGNSTAPHLHFHVMDGPSPLNANGLPFVFRKFASRGVLASGADDVLEKGQAAKIDARLSGSHENQLPLNNQVVDFE